MNNIQQQQTMIMGLMATAKEKPLNLVVNNEPMSLVYIETLNKYVFNKQIKSADEIFNVLLKLAQNKITIIEY